VVLGSESAGSAGVYQQFTLSNGDKLRLLTGDIKTTGGGSVAGTQLRPDIQVAVNAQEEHRLWEDPYSKAVAEAAAGLPKKTSSKGGVKAATKINEAALVRRQREDQARAIDDDPDAERTGVIEKPKAPELRDPTLARALDVLQGISILGSQIGPSN
jgi:C-terminal processing protease CtpA/Prc